MENRLFEYYIGEEKLFNQLEYLGGWVYYDKYIIDEVGLKGFLKGWGRLEHIEFREAYFDGLADLIIYTPTYIIRFRGDSKEEGVFYYHIEKRKCTISQVSHGLVNSPVGVFRIKDIKSCIKKDRDTYILSLSSGNVEIDIITYYDLMYIMGKISG